jgi:fructose-bisphosphate aldolase, class II
MSLSNNRTLAILDAASKGRYGVLAAIAYNIEQLTALVRAAEAARSPLILQLFPSTLKQLPSLVWAASAAAKSATVPISIHVDHAQDEAQIREVAAALPLDSIMVDMSHYEHAENLQKTRELTILCHKHGIAVEAESGRINGGEDGIADTGDLEALFTTPEEVEDFLSVGVQMLAPSVGNIHGDYPPSGPRLQFDRLRSVGEQIRGKAQLVLHGTNDFPPELVQECVQAGVTKLNVNKLVLQCWSDHLKGHADDSIVKLIDDGMDVLQAETERWMQICGSAGKA